MRKLKRFFKDESGDAIVVEATFLFPFIIMIFMGIILLSLYLPRRAQLQEATQYAAIVIGNELSDPWAQFNPSTLKYDNLWQQTNYSPPNVYAELFRNATGRYNSTRAQTVVNEYIKSDFMNGILPRYPRKITATSNLNNLVIYREVIVTAKEELTFPPILGFAGIPGKVTITATAKATVQNGDEFIRNIDIAFDVADKIGLNKENLGKVKDWFKK